MPTDPQRSDPATRRRSSRIVTAVNSWFADAARDLPWRPTPTRTVTPWQVMVSEFMLQQTPVSRVLEPWTNWVHRWPSPAALADAPVAEAIRAWGRLGYPRRALRLHRAATEITDRFDGRVPAKFDDLRSLPGVGDYTAAAIATFAFGQRHAVCDVNVRRVLARAIDGRAQPAPNPKVEQAIAEQMLPRDTERAVTWAAAAMELGALVCTSRSPDCPSCPIAKHCAWRAAGHPAAEVVQRTQAWHGTDRQCRGRLMAHLRSTDQPVPAADLIHCWPDDDDQRDRCLSSLVEDGLVVEVENRFALPH
ncbi:A/G-specific adenine glycosylase [Enemella sp. A6]|uniref:A/G-specific adenine glycosylase n=1 Tax=Enemella sp. A6 TaxID=3440152 RepID=UPI003EBF84E8